MTERRDIRGRRIGRNWWREFNLDLFYCADAAWQAQCEEASVGYATERAEFAEHHPRPTLKSFLLANAGMHTEPEDRCYPTRRAA